MREQNERRRTVMEIGQAIRQGDVILMRIKAVPKRTRRRDKGAATIIVEYGEATGHAHTLDPSDVEAYDVLSEAEMIIIGQVFKVLEPTPLIHQEHGALVLDPGIYERWYQVEDDGESERQVAD